MKTLNELTEILKNQVGEWSSRGLLEEEMKPNFASDKQEVIKDTPINYFKKKQADLLGVVSRHLSALNKHNDSISRNQGLTLENHLLAIIWKDMCSVFIKDGNSLSPLNNTTDINDQIKSGVLISFLNDFFSNIQQSPTFIDLALLVCHEENDFFNLNIKK